MNGNDDKEEPVSPADVRMAIARQRERELASTGRYGAQARRARALAARRLRAAEHGYLGPLTRQEIAAAGAHPVRATWQLSGNGKKGKTMSEAQANAPAPAEGRYGYIALYGSQRTEVWADSAYGAQQKAQAFFKPPKSRRHLVTVHLAEVDGQPVTQVITS